MATARQIAINIVTEDEGPNRFFSDASRELMIGVQLSLMQHCPLRWTFRDLLLILRNQDYLRQTLERSANTRDLCEYFKEERTFQNIRSCMASKLGRFEPIAACWDRASESIALSDWVRGESVLVLGYDPSIRHVMETVNKMLFQRVTELLLALPDSTTRRSWVFNDEATQTGNLAEPLSGLATFGRSSGCRLVLGFQDIEGLRKVFGKEQAHEITGMCSNKALLRMDSPETAQWAQSVVGSFEALERRRSSIPGDKSKDATSSEQLQKRDAVLASEFLSLPPTNRTNGLTGYYLSPFTGVFRSTLSAAEIDRRLVPPNKQIAPFVPRPPEHQLLRPFDAGDLRRLGLRPSA